MRVSLVTILMAILMGTGCQRVASDEGYGEGGASSLSEIKINLPNKNQFDTTRQELLSGYRLVVEPLSNGCQNPTKVDDRKDWSAAPLTAKLVQGCDYAIGLQLGTLSGSALTEVYYSNMTEGRGRQLAASEIAGKASLNLRLTLKVTDAGTRAGFGSNGGNNTDPDGDLILDLDLEDGEPTPTPGGGPTPTPDPKPTPTPNRPTPTPNVTPTPTPTPNVTPTPTPPSGGGNADFGAVKPIFDTHCSECHHPGFSPDFTQFPFKGTSLGMRAVMDKVVETVSGSGGPVMPPAPRDRLSAREIELLRTFRDSL